MVADEPTRELIEGFRLYIEEYVATDDRYGPAQRLDRPDGSVFETRFIEGDVAWFEVVVQTGSGTAPSIHVGFGTRDRAKKEEIDAAVQEGEGELSGFVGSGFVDAGLDRAEPPVTVSEEEGTFRFRTALTVEAIDDLEAVSVRDQALRMLEGYLIAFGPIIVQDDEAS